MDLINRQDAIDAMRNLLSDVAADTAEIRLNELPSAEPEVIRCKDCKNSAHWYRDRRRCFLWSEDGVSVFDDGFCNYAAKDIATIIENEKDMRVIAKNAEPEIIRCKNCKHWYQDADTGMACEFTNMGQPEDGFCNWGERR